MPSSATISRELKHRLAMSRTKVHNVSENRNEADRTDFWTNCTTHASRPGIHGVPVDCLLGLHGKTSTYVECLQAFGHSPVGAPCVRHGPAPSSQPSYNVILAVDAVVGCVCYLMYHGTLNRDTFYCWVALQVCFFLRKV